MATGGLYGSTTTGDLVATSGAESTGLYGNNTNIGGTYFEWLIFKESTTAPSTPTGGSWSFTTNVGTPPTGWSNTPPASPASPVWVSIALVNSRSTAALSWSTPGQFVLPAGSGTVTSVGMTVPSFLSVSGSPVTTTGTLAVGLSGTPLPVANGGTGTATPSLVAGSNVSVTGTWPNQTISSTSSGSVTSVTATSPVQSTGGTAPVISMPAATSTTNGYLTSSDWTTFNNKGSGTVTSVSGTTGRITSTGGTTPVVDLASGIATPSTTGSSSLIPVITVDTYGRVTSITTASNPQGTVTSVAALTLGTTGTDLSSSVATGTTTPVITLNVPTASATNRGVLSAADWTTFNNKQPAGSYLTNGGPLGTPSSGTATNLTGLPLSTGVTGTLPVSNGGTGTTTPSLVAGTNVTITGTWPNQTINSTASGGGGGTVTSVAATVPSFLSVSGSPITTSGTLAFSYSGTALPVANGGTGVTASSGANSVMLRDANQNTVINSLTEGFVNVAAAGTTTTLTASSAPNYCVTGSGGQTYQLPDATTLTAGTNYFFNNNQTSGTIVVKNNPGTTIATIQAGGYVEVLLLVNSLAAGSWDVHNYAPSNVSWSTNTFDYSGSITSATWNGTTVAINRGGTGQTTQAAAITALTGTQTNGRYLRSDGTNASLSAIVAADVPTLNQNTTGTAANITATSNSTLTTLSALSLPGSQVSGNISGNAANVTGTVAVANGGSGATTAQGAINTFAGAVTSGSYLRGNGTNVVMSAIQAADVPTLNQNTTGTAANVTGIVAVANGGTGTTTPSLVAGTNVTVTGTWPNQTINSSSMTYPGAGIPVSTGTAWGTSKVTPTGDIVGTTDTQTLSAKTLTNPTITNYVETAYVANTSTALTVSLTNGTIQILTLTANATITMPTAVAGKSFVIFLRQDATGSRSVTWSTVSWPSGTAPTITGTASKQDIFSFFSDGTSWYGTTVGQNYT
jgi:hypothetical protein